MAPRDSDGDGLDDKTEQAKGTDPYNADSDDDGVSDRDEVRRHFSNPLSKDSDADGLGDAEERRIGTSLYRPDTDGDSIPDGLEVAVGTTNPWVRDTPEQAKAILDANPLAAGFVGTNTDDSDGDQRADWIEIHRGTDHQDATSVPDHPSWDDMVNPQRAQAAVEPAEVDPITGESALASFAPVEDPAFAVMTPAQLSAPSPSDGFPATAPEPAFAEPSFAQATPPSSADAYGDLAPSDGAEPGDPFDDPSADVSFA